MSQQSRFNYMGKLALITGVSKGLGKAYAEELAARGSNLALLARSKQVLELRYRDLGIAKGIIDSCAKFRWTFRASTDFICRMSEDEIRLFGASGVSHMGFGTESTSKAVLKLMNKRHQRVDEMYEIARRAASECSQDQLNSHDKLRSYHRLVLTCRLCRREKKGKGPRTKCQ